jgi:hypothetical protein
VQLLPTQASLMCVSAGLIQVTYFLTVLAVSWLVVDLRALIFLSDSCCDCS